MLSPVITSFLKRTGLCAALALLAGCATTPKTAMVEVEVSCPPAPQTGSQRIVAYDAYAAAFYKTPDIKPTAAVAAAELISAVLHEKPVLD